MARIKKYRSIRAIAMVLAAIAVLSNATTVKAEPSGNASSYGEMEFDKGDSEGLLPTDPEDPEEKITVDPRPEDPDDPGPEPIGEEGLYILLAPALDFGLVKISDEDMDYFAKAQYLLNVENDTYAYRPNYLEVVDLRGSLEGWSVRVKTEEQFICEMGNELTGAQIIFRNGWVNSMMDDWEDAEVEVVQDIVLIPQEEQVAMYAEDGYGAGRWYGLFGERSDFTNENSEGKTVIDEIDGKEVIVQFNPNITLEVPGNTKKLPHSYSTRLLWTISNTP